MSVINLVWFGGMAPRQGEQHLPAPHATDAQNTNLYSGELRPLKKPSLAHKFARPGDDDFITPEPPDITDPPDYCEPVSPLPPIPPDSGGELCVSPAWWSYKEQRCVGDRLPTEDDLAPPPDPNNDNCLPIPPGCIPVVIEDPGEAAHTVVGNDVILAVSTNADATAPVTYQWFKENVAIPGATDAIYAFEGEWGSTTEYRVKVTNPCTSGVVSPPYIVEIEEKPTGPECLPYDCEALAQYALGHGMGYSEMSFMRGSVVMPADGYYPDDLTGGANPAVPRAKFIASWAGQSLWYNSGHLAYSYGDEEPEEDRTLNWCEGEGYRLILSSNPSSTTDNEERIQYDGLPVHQTLLHYGGLSQRSSGANIFFTGTRWDFQHSPDSYSGGAYVSGDSNINNGCTMVDGSIRVVGHGGITILFPNPVPWLAENATTVWVEYGEIWQEEGTAWNGNYTLPYFQVYTTYTIHCILNGDHRTFTNNNFRIAISWNVPVKDITKTHTRSASLNGTVCHLKGMVWGTDALDVDELNRALVRNDSSYEPPEYCP